MSSAIALVGGCAGGGEQSAAPPDPGPVHVHGLGTNPADGALMIATHTGLWRVAPESRSANRVAESRQDIMGFTVAGPDHFLASGHPDIGEIDSETPPHLGLVESRDGGRNWKRVSLQGEADFHSLRLVGDRLLALNARDGTLMLSGADRRSWVTSTPRAALTDIVASPDGVTWVASGHDGLYSSDDGGATWTRTSPRTGLLAWPASDALYLVGSDGLVHLSSDGGKRFTARGRTATPTALLATDINTLYVAAHFDGTVYVSRDRGHTWEVRTRASAGSQSDTDE